jgi:NADH:ubiquinone oxidoreductase subunit H
MVIIAGWSSNSGYSLLGGFHALAQTISYEVRMVLFHFLLLSWVVDIIWLLFIFFEAYFWLIGYTVPSRFV